MMNVGRLLPAPFRTYAIDLPVRCLDLYSNEPSSCHLAQIPKNMWKWPKLIPQGFTMVGNFGVMFAALPLATGASTHNVPSPAAIDAKVVSAMKATGARSLAIAVIDRGRVIYVRPYGVRTATGALLQSNSIMYEASLRAVFLKSLILRSLWCRLEGSNP